MHHRACAQRGSVADAAVLQHLCARTDEHTLAEDYAARDVRARVDH
jgi:hypothetical protein